MNAAVQLAIPHQVPVHLPDLPASCSQELDQPVLGPLKALISHYHAPDTLLAPAEKDISHEYQTGFLGMTEAEVSLDRAGKDTQMAIARKLEEVLTL